MTNNTENKTTEVTIDASDKKLGRLASEVAVLLQGKKQADYAPNKVGDVKVVIENIDNLELSEAKLDSKIYHNYSGYPGGLKETTLRKLIAKKGKAEVLRRAVNGMLPKNKLQKIRLSNLEIK